MNDYRYAHLEFELGGLGLNSTKELAVYKGGYDTAFNNDEMDIYKVNLWANQYCAEDIDAALQNVKTPQEMEQAYNQVAEIYGNERVCSVLAVSIEAREQMQSFEKFSQGTRDWSKNYEMTGASAPEHLMFLEGNKRPPLLITDTATLENFIDIVRENEITQTRENQPERETFTVEISPEMQETIAAINEKIKADEITINEANSGVSLNENGDLSITDGNKILENAAIIPPVEDVVKVMAVKDIVAQMPTPEMMKIVEAQLMTRSIDDLQAVYPHVFENAEPDRSVKAEKIVEELLERSPLTNEELPGVFNEVFNKKIVEPVTGEENPYAGDLIVALDNGKNGEIVVKDVNEKYLEDLKTVFLYNGVRNFEADDIPAPDGVFEIRISGEELPGLTQEESQNLAVGFAKSVFKNWNESLGIPLGTEADRPEISFDELNGISQEKRDLIYKIGDIILENLYDTTNGEPEDYFRAEKYADMSMDELQETLKYYEDKYSADISEKRKLADIVAEFNETAGTEITANSIKESAFRYSYDFETLESAIDDIPAENRDKAATLIEEIRDYTDNYEKVTVHTQYELDSISDDFDGKITVIGGTEAEPIEVEKSLVFVENEWSDSGSVKSYVLASECTVYAGDSTNVTSYDCVVYAEAYANIEARGDSEVNSDHKSWVEAFDNTKVTAFESNVVANDEVTVSCTEGWVQGNGNAQIFSYNAEVVLNGSATVEGEVVNLTDNRNKENISENQQGNDGKEFDNKTMDLGFEVTKQERPPQGDMPKNDFQKITEPTETAKEKMKENHGVNNKKSLSERLKEKIMQSKEKQTKETTRETKEREEISH